mmetsp:Transcript_2843/g.3359  ORF Transcript_2843/g.3359 Transcript_2843/m.3359 type:complete len:178 (+) Transcript_2843:122-655(+)|eukprot:CAMPEP_0170788380 /NCGR_PEP_ID=MMETSP0733-20121128/18909_1 /TAXON_ID=186038 /ORGANISM="Fragilariopsis kerguelensis, Strain L26-C5" /LENGTH=177 /DNA_ID=CAMNT_0011134897 /DNA_START=80 /DNA_END=613 /DNA_ORIENTATION=-
MTSNNTNHFGNPLVTGIVGGSSSKQQYYNTNNSSLLQSPSTPRRSPQHHQLPTIISPIQHSRLTPSTSLNHTTNKTRRMSLPSYVPSGSNHSSTSSLLSESQSQEPLHHRHSHSHRHGKSFSYDSSSSSSIGVPSMYPGSQHHRNNTFESFLLEELEDFDEIFGSSRSVPQPNNHHI